MSLARRFVSPALEGVATVLYFTWYVFLCTVAFLLGCDLRRDIEEMEDEAQ